MRWTLLPRWWPSPPRRFAVTGRDELVCWSMGFLSRRRGRRPRVIALVFFGVLVATAFTPGSSALARTTSVASGASAGSRKPPSPLAHAPPFRRAFGHQTLAAPGGVAADATGQFGPGVLPGGASAAVVRHHAGGLRRPRRSRRHRGRPGRADLRRAAGRRPGVGVQPGRALLHRVRPAAGRRAGGRGPGVPAGPGGHRNRADLGGRQRPRPGRPVRPGPGHPGIGRAGRSGRPVAATDHRRVPAGPGHRRPRLVPGPPRAARPGYR